MLMGWVFCSLCHACEQQARKIYPISTRILTYRFYFALTILKYLHQKKARKYFHIYALFSKSSMLCYLERSPSVGIICRFSVLFQFKNTLRICIWYHHVTDWLPRSFWWTKWSVYAKSCCRFYLNHSISAAIIAAKLTHR